LKKINIVFTTVLLFFAIILTSCELFLIEPDGTEGRIILVSVGQSYDNSDDDTYLQYNNHNLNNLHGTLNDVKMLSYALQTQSEEQEKDFYWIPLTDECDVGSENFSTEINIKNAISYLIDGSSDKPLIIKNPKSYPLATIFDKSTTVGSSEKIELNRNDLLVFHYSGHGDSDSGSLLLRTNNDLNLAISFKLADTYNLFRNLPCKSLILLDSCYSGNIIPLSDNTISTNDSRVDENWFGDYFAFLLNDSSDINSTSTMDDNIFILTATTSDKLSYELPFDKKTIGAFTYSLLKSLGWNIDSAHSDTIGSRNDTVPAMKNGSISLDSIYEYVNGLSHNKRYYDARVIGGRYDLVLFE
jgi:hypothetical protein